MWSIEQVNSSPRTMLSLISIVTQLYLNTMILDSRYKISRTVSIIVRLATQINRFGIGLSFPLKNYSKNTGTNTPTTTCFIGFQSLDFSPNSRRQQHNSRITTTRLKGTIHCSWRQFSQPGWCGNTSITSPSSISNCKQP